MNAGKALTVFALSACLLCAAGSRSPARELPKKRIFVVSSYHADYAWSRETNKGFCAALLKFGYFDNQDEIVEYTRNDSVETSRAVIKKMWMDAKRRGTKADLTKATLRITVSMKEFRPDIIFLGDDEAGNYIGNQVLDTRVPVVFWGFNNNPVKYGLVDTAERPGHNVTGIYQSGYYAESLRLLKRLAPKAKTFAVLTDDSPSGRAQLKGIEFLARTGGLPLKLIHTVTTNDYGLWKRRALELQRKVDAFFVVQYSTLRDEQEHSVANEDVARWYVENIKIPEAASGIFVKQGLLCAADDSGFKQAYEAVTAAHDVMTKGANPATYPCRTPQRGALIVNRERAKQLGLALTAGMGIEEYVGDNSLGPISRDRQ